jgi:hypothetical protein
MTLTISVPDRIIEEIPIAEMEWFNDQSIMFDHMPTMETTVTCMNYTHRDVWVAERSGAVSKTSPKSNSGSNCFCIKISRRRSASTQTEFELYDMVEDGTGKIKTSSGLSAMSRSYQISNNRMHGMHTCHEIIFTIPMQKIQSHGGSVYHPETDMVLALSRDHAVHPGSPQSRLRSLHRSRGDDFTVLPDDGPELKELKTILGMRRGSDMARVMIGIIDSERKYGDKYVNLLGTPHLVKATVSDKLLDGVYVVRDEKVNEAGRSSKATITHYSFEDVGTSGIKLFNSSNDALTYGDPERAAERKAEELKAQNLVLKQQLDHQQTQSKLTITQVSDKIDKEAVARKDYYEERSHRRKDSSEDMKYVYAGLAGFLGLIALFLKK